MIEQTLHVSDDHLSQFHNELHNGMVINPYYDIH